MMTKKQFEEYFKAHVLPGVVDQYEQDWIPDKPARRQAWNDTVDAMIKGGQLPERAGDWTHPKWLETMVMRPCPPGERFGNPFGLSWAKLGVAALFVAVGVGGIILGRIESRKGNHFETMPPGYPV